jgi:trimeric autotransporter adhesin
VSPLSYTVSGRQVVLTWSGSAGATDYVLEAGTSSGASNVITVATAATSLSATAPPNTYYVRVRPRNACGSGAYSNEVSFTVS